jgi:SAM-dependent methyltransferase
VSNQDLDLQLDWDVSKLHGRWPTGPDNVYMLQRLKDVTVEATAAGAHGRVLEVAASEAILSCRLNLEKGLESFVLEPSQAMLEKARQRMAEYGAEIALVRGIAETPPFRAGSFDRVLCDSAIDHLADPDFAVQEMARLLAPEGRLVIGAVNYGSPNVRISRLVYRAQRALGYASLQEHLFWDTPVPIEHTFECTYALLLRMCGDYLELERAVGVSMGWMFPGWGSLLARLAPERAARILRRIDRFASGRPRLADYVLTVWRPKARRSAAAAAPAAVSGAGPLRRETVTYRIRIADEAAHWSHSSMADVLAEIDKDSERMGNVLFTGDADRSWLEDLIGRGPFSRAALLGCDGGVSERTWLEAGASEKLDVYDLSPSVVRVVRSRLGVDGLGRFGAIGRRVRFIIEDLNFPRLPEARYDVIWSNGCLHHIVNLENLFAAVERALCDDGLFAFHTYIGERRLRFAPERLQRINRVLQDVPAQFRRGGVTSIAAPALDQISPFCGVRSDEIVDLVEARFDVVHRAMAGALFPLHLYLDLGAIERREPELSKHLFEAEVEALGDPAMRPCATFMVLRKRGSR